MTQRTQWPSVPGSPLVPGHCSNQTEPDPASRKTNHKRRGKNQLTLKPGHLLHYDGENNSTTGEVGFLVHKQNKDQVLKVESTSTTRVIYLILRLNKRCTAIQLVSFPDTFCEPICFFFFLPILHLLLGDDLF